MEDSELKLVVSAHVAGVKSTAPSSLQARLDSNTDCLGHVAANKTEAEGDCDKLRRRINQFRARSAKKRKKDQADLEEGEIDEEEESRTTTNSSPHISSDGFTPFKRLPFLPSPIDELCTTFCTTGTTCHPCSRFEKSFHHS